MDIIAWCMRRDAEETERLNREQLQALQCKMKEGEKDDAGGVGPSQEQG